MRKTLWKLAGALALVGAAPPSAEWRQARTDHFILTIDDTEQGAREFALKLERFDAALRKLYGVPDTADQHARPIEIYALKPDLFQKTCGCYSALGYYSQRPARSVIFSAHMPAIDKKTKIGWWSSQTVLLHEYGHHFAYSSFPTAYPYWFSEGFAEFNANASFEPDGSIIVGYPANYRAEGLKSTYKLSARQLFDPIRYKTPNLDLLYGRGWLLTHYAMLNTERKKQLGAYLEALNKGKPSLEAAELAFGDLKQLNDALDAYAKGKLQAPLYVAPGPQPQVTVTTLPPGQAAMMPIHAQVTSGIADEYRLGPAMKAGKIAERYPDDPIVQIQWAAAEQYAGRLDRAEKGADVALALKPDFVDALARKGMIAVERLEKAKSKDAAQWSAARAWFLKANRADPNAVMPLYLYYASFVAADGTPTPGAIKGLMRAAALAPESVVIRQALARQLLIDGDAAGTRLLLQRMAFTPHRPRQENVARQLVDLIDAGKVDEAKALMAKKEEEEEEKRD